ncbi:MAG TPA: hypothetical protein VH350_15970 [Candidatus Sulfotelmatobacter sp.]|nr:hypothetical protein [Candidatus Sulfotelmatobacter sp.]
MTCFETRFSAEHVIHFIFMVRTLRVGGSCGQNVESGAHGGNAEEFAVQLAALGVVCLEFVHVEKSV